MEWNQTYGGEDPFENYVARSLVATSDGGYALAGCYELYEFWLIKTDENGIAPVVPETVWVILPLLVIATLSIFISKKKLLHPRSKER